MSSTQLAQIVSRLDAEQFGGYAEIELIMAKEIPVGDGHAKATIYHDGLAAAAHDGHTPRERERERVRELATRPQWDKALVLFLWST